MCCLCVCVCVSVLCGRRPLEETCARHGSTYNWFCCALKCVPQIRVSLLLRIQFVLSTIRRLHRRLQYFVLILNYGIIPLRIKREDQITHLIIQPCANCMLFEYELDHVKRGDKLLSFENDWKISRIKYQDIHWHFKEAILQFLERYSSLKNSKTNFIPFFIQIPQLS